MNGVVHTSTATHGLRHLRLHPPHMTDQARAHLKEIQIVPYARRGVRAPRPRRRHAQSAPRARGSCCSRTTASRRRADAARSVQPCGRSSGGLGAGVSPLPPARTGAEARLLNALRVRRGTAGCRPAAAATSGTAVSAIDLVGEVAGGSRRSSTRRAPGFAPAVRADTRASSEGRGVDLRARAALEGDARRSRRRGAFTHGR